MSYNKGSYSYADFVINNLAGEMIAEEEPMSVGGLKCHLCGANIGLESDESYKSEYKDNGINNKYESWKYIDYECGTQVVLREERNGEDKKRHSPKVRVGDKCIKVPRA